MTLLLCSLHDFKFKNGQSIKSKRVGPNWVESFFTSIADSFDIRQHNTIHGCHTKKIPIWVYIGGPGNVNVCIFIVTWNILRQFSIHIQCPFGIICGQSV
jgi:hypothetical protein